MTALGAPILLDATHGEGGGALLRTALAMAALTLQPLRATGIRGGTKYPGLTYEDMAIVRALAECCDAEVVGAQLGSNELSFLPTRRPRSISGRFGVLLEESKPGSVGALVVANTLVPVLARTGAYSSVSIQGETFGHGILSHDYFEHVTMAAFRRLGIYGLCDLIEAGFGRNSQGEARLEVEPSAIRGADWTRRGQWLRTRALITTTGLSKSIADRGQSHLEKLFQSAGIPIDIEIQTPEGRSAGAHCTVWSEFEGAIGGAVSMGQKGVRMEAVAQNAFDSHYEWYRSDATLDPFVADQIVLAAAIAESDTVFSVPKLTERLLTVIWVIKQFVPIRITVKGHESEPGVVEIRK